MKTMFSQLMIYLNLCVIQILSGIDSLDRQKRKRSAETIVSHFDMKIVKFPYRLVIQLLKLKFYIMIIQENLIATRKFL